MYDKSLSFVENLKNISAIIGFIILISGIFSSAVFFYIDQRNETLFDKRYLQLMEITKTLGPLYVSVNAYNEKKRVDDIRTLEDKIFNLEVKQSELLSKTPKESLTPFEIATLNRYKSQLTAIQIQP